MKKWILTFFLMIVINSAYTQIVVICTGEYAKVYHSKENCTGLNNCKGEIIKVSQSDAVNRYKLQRPCCVCWYPSPNGCATDDMPINNQPTKSQNYFLGRPMASRRKMVGHRPQSTISQIASRNRKTFARWFTTSASTACCT
mgnify:CR=1 FL=1